MVMISDRAGEVDRLISTCTFTWTRNGWRARVRAAAYRTGWSPEADCAMTNGLYLIIFFADILVKIASECEVVHVWGDDYGLSSSRRVVFSDEAA